MFPRLPDHAKLSLNLEAIVCQTLKVVLGRITLEGKSGHFKSGKGV